MAGKGLETTVGPRILRFCICGFNQIEPPPKFPESSKEQNLHLLHAGNERLAKPIYIILGITSNLEMILSIGEAVCRLYKYCTILYTRNFSILGFGVFEGPGYWGTTVPSDDDA